MTVHVGVGKSAFTVECELSLAGGVLVLFGPSGAGKSLTLQALAGLIKPKQGFLQVGGEFLFNSERRIFVPAHKRKIGYVPQHQSLFPFLNVIENVAFGLPRAERRPANPNLVALLEELGIAGLASSRPASLSGGERQRVALARALAVKPRLLLLDEPLASIDPQGRAALRRTLLDVIDRRQMSAVLVTHDPDEAFAFGDRLVLFERGRTTVDGTPESLLGGAPSVVVTGEPMGTPEFIGGGRARIHVQTATIEAPRELLETASGAPLKLELSARPRARPRG